MAFMTKLIELTVEERNHWLLHLNALIDDNPSDEAAINQYVISGTDLPNVNHPMWVHDWWEHPDLRTWIEENFGG